MGRGTARGPQNKAKMPVEVVEMWIAVVKERVLVEAEDRHRDVVEFLRPTKIGDCDVDMIDTDDFDFHSYRDRDSSAGRQLSIKAIDARAAYSAATPRQRSAPIAFLLAGQKDPSRADAGR